MKYTKVHGCGNDAILIDAIDHAALARHFQESREDALAREVRSLCARTTGVGADVVIVLIPTVAGADCGMLVFNSDGGRAEMCSTGVRAAAKHLLLRRRMLKDTYSIATGRGVLDVRLSEDGATVRMGEPVFELASVPAIGAELGASGSEAIELGPPSGMLRMLTMPCTGACVSRLSVCSMGNPHLVLWCQGVRAEEIPLALLGPAMEHHPAFPRRVNVHFVEVRSRSSVAMRSWERGAGATSACGTGACAVVAAGVRAGRLERDVLVEVPGGSFRIAWDERDNQMVLTGAIEEICTGEWSSGPRLETEELPIVTTPRLSLRSAKLSDAARIAQLADEREIAEMTLAIPHPYSERDAQEWIERQGERVREGRERIWLITLNGAEGEGTIVGCVGLHIDPAHGWAELGYWIGKPYWGRGYASEAAAAAVEHGFVQLGLARVQAHHMAHNLASGRVLEKAGMAREGLLKSKYERFGKRADVVAFAMTREMWLARRSG